MKRATCKSVEAYLSALAPRQRARALQLRRAIQKAAPKSVEAISYNMPCFKLHGILAWYAAYERHMGFYPKASGIAKFKGELGRYKHAKGSVQFPIDKPIPAGLVGRIIRFRLEENLSKA